MKTGLVRVTRRVRFASDTDSGNGQDEDDRPSSTKNSEGDRATTKELRSQEIGKIKTATPRKRSLTAKSRGRIHASKAVLSLTEEVRGKRLYE